MLRQSRDMHAAVFVFVDMERFFPFLCFLGGYLVLSEVVLSCELLVHLGVIPSTYFLINEYICVCTRACGYSFIFFVLKILQIN